MERRMTTEKKFDLHGFTEKGKASSFNIAVLQGRTADLHALLANPATPLDEALKAIKRFHDAAFDAGTISFAIGTLGAVAERKAAIKAAEALAHENLQEAKTRGRPALAFNSDAKGG